MFRITVTTDGLGIEIMTAIAEKVITIVILIIRIMDEIMEHALVLKEKMSE